MRGRARMRAHIGGQSTDYFVFIKINMKTPEKKSSEFPSGPRSYFTNFPKFDINKINTSMCKSIVEAWLGEF